MDGPATRAAIQQLQQPLLLSRVVVGSLQSAVGQSVTGMEADRRCPCSLGGGEVTPVMRTDGQVRSSLTFFLRRADEVVLVLVLVLDATRCRAVSGMRFAAAGAEVCEWL